MSRTVRLRMLGRLTLAGLALCAVAGCSAIAGVSAPDGRAATAGVSAAVATGPVDATGAADATGAGAGSVPQPYDPTQLDPRVTQATIGSTIGVSGWAAAVRPPESVTGPIKRRLMREHRYYQPLSAYELDHFIPLGVGGSSNLSNLWLEPISEAKAKDRDEVLVHRKVTDGEWTLSQGQQYVRDHWAIHYAQ